MILKRLKWIAAFLAMIPCLSYAALPLHEATGIVSVVSDSLSQNTSSDTAVYHTDSVNIGHGISATADSSSWAASSSADSLSAASNSRITVYIADPRIINGTMYNADYIIVKDSQTASKPDTAHQPIANSAKSIVAAIKKILSHKEAAYQPDILLKQSPITSDISSSGSGSHSITAPSSEVRWKAVSVQVVFLISLHTDFSQYDISPYILQFAGSSHCWGTIIRPPPAV